MTGDLRLGSITADRIFAGSIIGGARCRLALPYERPPRELGGNARAHWRSEARAKAKLRADVATVARSAGLHRLTGRVEHVTAQLLWAPGDRRRRDSDNLWKMQKIACDAIARGRGDFVGLDLVPDDSPAWMTKEAPQILPPPEPKGMWLVLDIRFKEEA